MPDLPGLTIDHRLLVVDGVRVHHFAGVMRESDGDLVVFGLDGCAIPVGPNRYKGGQRLADAVRAGVPAELFYDEAPAARRRVHRRAGEIQPRRVAGKLATVQ